MPFLVAAPSLSISLSAGWIQHRETATPKEYHYDSALTWCRDNGWKADELQHCPFYPQIGSIFYLTATGGPTGRPMLAPVSHSHGTLMLHCTAPMLLQ